MVQNISFFSKKFYFLKKLNLNYLINILVVCILDEKKTHVDHFISS